MHILLKWAGKSKDKRDEGDKGYEKEKLSRLQVALFSLSKKAVNPLPCSQQELPPCGLNVLA